MNIFPSARTYIDRGLDGDTIIINRQQASNGLRELLQLLQLLLSLFMMMIMIIIIIIIIIIKKKKKKKKRWHQNGTLRLIYDHIMKFV